MTDIAKLSYTRGRHCGKIKGYSLSLNHNRILANHQPKITVATITKKRKADRTKSARKNKIKVTSKKPSRGFEKAWEFWKTVQLDLSNFKFDREEANAR